MVAIHLVGASRLAAQTTLYWDIDGATSGAGGATPTGTWKTSGGANKNWGTATAGTSATANWTNDSIAVFSAGTDATGSYTVTVASAPTVDSIFVEEGDVTFINSSLTLTGTTPGVDVASGASATFDTKFLGANGLVKAGGGLLILNNTGNNYTGDTLINAGTLQLGVGTNILPNATAVTVASGASLTLTAGASTHTIASLSGAGSVDLNDNTLKVGNASSTTYSGALGGSGTLLKQGAGTLSLTGNNSSFSGALALNVGNLVVTGSNALGAATTGNNIASGAALQFSGGATVTETDLTIRGTGDGSGVLRSLDGANTLAAGITLASAASVTADAGSTLTLSGDITRVGQDLTVGGAGNIVLSGALSGSGAAGLIKDGTGSLTLSGSSANTSAGAVSVNDGMLLLGKTAGTDATGGGALTIGDGIGAAGSATLRLLADNQLPDGSGLLTVNADGLLDLNNHAETIDRLAGTGEIAFGTSGALTIGANDGNSTFDGTLSGSGDFTKTGSGLLTLATDLTFNGTFILAGGTLRLTDMTLNLDTLNLTGNASIDFGGTSSQLIVTSLNLNGFSLSITNWSDAVDYFFAQNWTGAVNDTRGAAPMNQVSFNSFTAADTQWQGYDSQVTPVPEPSTYGRLLLGALTALFVWRRRIASVG